MLFPQQLERCPSIADLRRLAERRLPRPLFDFVDGGAGSEGTLHDNERAFRALTLAPRYAVDVSRRVSGIDLLGVPASMPLVIAPVGFAGLLWPGGEAAARRSRPKPDCPSACQPTPTLRSKTLREPRGTRALVPALFPQRPRMDEPPRRPSAAAGLSRFVRDHRSADRRPPRARHPQRFYRPAAVQPFEPRISRRGSAGWPALRDGRCGSAISRVLPRRRYFVSIAQHVASLFDPSGDLRRCRAASRPLAWAASH